LALVNSLSPAKLELAPARKSRAEQFAVRIVWLTILELEQADDYHALCRHGSARDDHLFADNAVKGALAAGQGPGDP
jgi:hypothetical protein